MAWPPKEGGRRRFRSRCVSSPRRVKLLGEKHVVFSGAVIEAKKNRRYAHQYFQQIMNLRHILGTCFFVCFFEVVSHFALTLKNRNLHYVSIVVLR